MKYVNAKDILPEDILKQLQTYAAGTLLYVPKEGEEKSWGEASGYRAYLLKRNRMILNFFQYGVSLDEISNTFGLSQGTVKKIVYNKKHRVNLYFRPEISSAEEYAECGLLEEWVHTYLLFVRKNKEFSDGLYLEDRYFIGPVKMPLTLFQRSSGPEEQMKWRVDATVFWHNVQNWTERIAGGKTTPPLIFEYAEDGIRVNDGRHRLEMYRQLGITKAWAVCWKTRKRYEVGPPEIPAVPYHKGQWRGQNNGGTEETATEIEQWLMRKMMKSFSSNFRTFCSLRTLYLHIPLYFTPRLCCQNTFIFCIRQIKRPYIPYRQQTCI